MIGAGSSPEIVRPETGGVLRGEIADDGIGLPEDEAVVVDGRHETVWIQIAVFGRVHDAKGSAGIDALVLERHFLAAPEHFLDIDRIAPSPDDQHACPSGICARM